MDTLRALLHRLFGHLPLKGAWAGKSTFRGGIVAKNKNTPRNPWPTLIVFALHTRPAKPNRWREKSKNMQKWAFLPQKGAKGGVPEFSIKF